MDEIKLNSKGKPYKSGKPPSAEQLEKLKQMRIKAMETLKTKGKQTISEKALFQEVKKNKETKHMIEKKERIETVNQILEEKNKPIVNEEVVIKKKKKKKIVYESSDESDKESENEEEIQRKLKPKIIRKPKQNEDEYTPDNDNYQKLLTLNSNRILQEKLMNANINSYQMQMQIR